MWPVLGATEMLVVLNSEQQMYMLLEDFWREGETTTTRTADTAWLRDRLHTPPRIYPSAQITYLKLQNKYFVQHPSQHYKKGGVEGIC